MHVRDYRAVQVLEYLRSVCNALHARVVQFDGWNSYRSPLKWGIVVVMEV